MTYALQANLPLRSSMHQPVLPRLVAAVAGLFPPRLAPDRIDSPTGLFNFGGLMSAADELLAPARRDGRPLTVIVIEFSDLREVHQLYGHAVRRKVIANVVRKLQAVAGRRGLAGRTGAGQFTLVLPTGRDRALRSLERVLGKTARIEFDGAGDEIVLVPELAVDSTDAATESIQPLWDEMCRDLAARHEHEVRRRHCLQRERERHSRPMALPMHG